MTVYMIICPFALKIEKDGQQQKVRETKRYSPARNQLDKTKVRFQGGQETEGWEELVL